MEKFNSVEESVNKELKSLSPLCRISNAFLDNVWAHDFK